MTTTTGVVGSRGLVGDENEGVYGQGSRRPVIRTIPYLFSSMYPVVTCVRWQGVSLTFLMCRLTISVPVVSLQWPIETFSSMRKPKPLNTPPKPQKEPSDKPSGCLCRSRRGRHLCVASVPLSTPQSRDQGSANWS